VGEVDYIPPVKAIQLAIQNKPVYNKPTQDIKHINTTLVPKDKDQENSKVNQSYVPSKAQSKDYKKQKEEEKGLIDGL